MPIESQNRIVPGELLVKRRTNILHFVVFIRLRQEVEIQYSMRHPNIVEVVAFDLGAAGHSPCLIMERMQESLFDLLSVEGIDMETITKVSILRDVCEVCTQLWRTCAANEYIL